MPAFKCFEEDVNYLFSLKIERLHDTELSPSIWNWLIISIRIY